MKRVAMGRRSAAVWMAAWAVGLMGGEMASGATWIGPAGGTYSWFDSFAWTPNAPTNNESVYVGNGGAPTINYGAAVAGTIYLGTGYSLGQSGGLVVGGNGLMSAGSMSIGYMGYGWVQQAGGAVVASGLQLGSNSRASGNYTLSDGTLEAGGAEILGYGLNSTAQFKQSGGIHTAGTLSGSAMTIAYGSAAAANYSLSGGQLSSYTLQIGYGLTSSGSMTQTGGQNTTGILSLGYSYGSVGSYALGSNGQLTATSEYIGYNGTGVFNQTGGIHRVGTNSSTGALYLGYQTGGQGTYNLSGNGQLLSGGPEYIGYGSTATGIMTQTGGVNSLGTAALYVGAYQPTLTGIYQLGGTGTLSAGTEYIGFTGTGTFTGMGAFQQSGGTNLAENVTVGGNGRYDMSGGTAQARGTFTVMGKATIGDPADPAAAPSLSASILNIGIATGTSSAGSLTLTSSAGVDVSTSLRVYPTGTLAIKSGMLTTPSLVNDGTVTLTGGTLALTIGPPLSVFGAITGLGAISVGAGATVTAGYIRQGRVTVAGSLQLKHMNSASSFNDLSIAPGGSVVLADDLAAWNYTGASPAGVLRQYLKSGQNGGDWAGPGLSSSAAAGDVVRVLGIGYIEASDLGVTTWGGVTVDSTSLLLKVVPYGDANMDGTITTDDYTLLDRGLALAYSGWSNGDFNYDGAVDSADVLIIDRSLMIQNGTLPSPSFLAAREAMYGEGYVAELIASVPEPSCISLGVMAGGLLLRRKRK